VRPSGSGGHLVEWPMIEFISIIGDFDRVFLDLNDGSGVESFGIIENTLSELEIFAYWLAR